MAMPYLHEQRLYKTEQELDLMRQAARITAEVELTESHTMDPEASVSALVLHHPDAKYFASS